MRREEQRSMQTRRLTMAQALVMFLEAQSSERDGERQPLFAGVFGIFGHGNVAGVGQALHQRAHGLRYYQARNEQAMVHTAVAYARMRRRLQTFACTSSIGPGATNMVTGAALATINRVPVLLLPGDIFAHRRVAPVLQQLEDPRTPDISVNDCFRPVSRYWDRIMRPEQLITSLPEAMRVLTSPAETGAVTLALPQDTQAEAFDYPLSLFEPRIWLVPRPRPDRELVRRAAARIRASRAPLIIAGGGVHYSGAEAALARLVAQTGIPVGETQAGKGSLPFDAPHQLGAIGVTGTPGANRVARDADLVIAIGTRLSDFTTASKTAFQHPDVQFIGINITEFDAYKHAALPLVGDAREVLDELAAQLAGYTVDAAYQAQSARYAAEWHAETERIFQLEHGPLPSQGEVIGAVCAASTPRDVVVCAAGSLPGDLHKLWRTRDALGYHLEYGYSCMGYEIAGGLGVRMADPSREVYVMVGDGSYLMMSSEIVTSIQEGHKLTIVLLDNHGYSSIGGLSAAVGAQEFGTEYRFRDAAGALHGTVLPVDLAANAESLGAAVLRCRTIGDVRQALVAARAIDRTVVIAVEVDRHQRVPGYESWWDVPVAEVAEIDSARAARAAYEAAQRRERFFL
jgi:3D-(3,5/4)-trihydroxycyclohexane-1,2-dione acylhydrolase (decyclizing)